MTVELAGVALIYTTIFLCLDKFGVANVLAIREGPGDAVLAILGYFGLLTSLVDRLVRFGLGCRWNLIRDVWSLLLIICLLVIGCGYGLATIASITAFATTIMNGV